MVANRESDTPDHKTDHRQQIRSTDCLNPSTAASWEHFFHVVPTERGVVLVHPFPIITPWLLGVWVGCGQSYAHRRGLFVFVRMNGITAFTLAVYITRGATLSPVHDSAILISTNANG